MVPAYDLPQNQAKKKKRVSTHHSQREGKKKKKFGIKQFVLFFLCWNKLSSYNLAHLSLDTGLALVDGILEYEVVKHVKAAQDAGYFGLVLVLVLVLLGGGLLLLGVRGRGGAGVWFGE